MLNSIEVNYSVLGASKAQKTKAFPYLHPNVEYLTSDFKNNKGNFNEFPFLHVDEKLKTIILNIINNETDIYDYNINNNTLLINVYMFKINENIKHINIKSINDNYYISDDNEYAMMNI